MSSKKKILLSLSHSNLNLPSINSKLISGPTSGPWSAFYKTDLEGNFCLVAKGNPYYQENKIQCCLEIVPIPVTI